MIRVWLEGVVRGVVRGVVKKKGGDNKCNLRGLSKRTLHDRGIVFQEELMEEAIDEGTETGIGKSWCVCMHLCVDAQ